MCGELDNGINLINGINHNGLSVFPANNLDWNLISNYASNTNKYQKCTFDSDLASYVSFLNSTQFLPISTSSFVHSVIQIGRLRLISPSLYSGAPFQYIRNIKQSIIHIYSTIVQINNFISILHSLNFPTSFSEQQSFLLSCPECSLQLGQWDLYNQFIDSFSTPYGIHMKLFFNDKIWKNYSQHDFVIIAAVSSYRAISKGAKVHIPSETELEKILHRIDTLGKILDPNEDLPVLNPEDLEMLSRPPIPIVFGSSYDTPMQMITSKQALLTRNVRLGQEVNYIFTNSIENVEYIQDWVDFHGLKMHVSTYPELQ